MSTKTKEKHALQAIKMSISSLRQKWQIFWKIRPLILIFYIPSRSLGRATSPKLSSLSASWWCSAYWADFDDSAITLSIAIPSRSILRHLPQVHHLHVRASSPWRSAEWSFSFPRMPLGGQNVHPTPTNFHVFLGDHVSLPNSISFIFFLFSLKRQAQSSGPDALRTSMIYRICATR